MLPFLCFYSVNFHFSHHCTLFYCQCSHCGIQTRLIEWTIVNRKFIILIHVKRKVYRFYIFDFAAICSLQINVSMKNRLMWAMDCFHWFCPLIIHHRIVDIDSGKMCMGKKKLFGTRKKSEKDSCNGIHSQTSSETHRFPSNVLEYEYEWSTNINDTQTRKSIKSILNYNQEFWVRFSVFTKRICALRRTVTWTETARQTRWKELMVCANWRHTEYKRMWITSSRVIVNKHNNKKNDRKTYVNSPDSMFWYAYRYTISRIEWYSCVFFFLSFSKKKVLPMVFLIYSFWYSNVTCRLFSDYCVFFFILTRRTRTKCISNWPVCMRLSFYRFAFFFLHFRVFHTHHFYLSQTIEFQRWHVHQMQNQNSSWNFQTLYCTVRCRRWGDVGKLVNNLKNHAYVTVIYCTKIKQKKIWRREMVYSTWYHCYADMLDVFVCLHKVNWHNTKLFWIQRKLS